MIATGAAALVLLLAWWLVLSPMHDKITRARARVASRTTTLEKMIRLAPLLRQNPAATVAQATTTRPRQPALSLLENAAATVGIKKNIRRIRPEQTQDGTTVVTISLEDILPLQCIRYLDLLEQDARTHTVTLHNRNGGNGHIDLLLTVQLVAGAPPTGADKRRHSLPQ